MCLVEYERHPEDRVAYLTLNRPEKLNAMSDELLAEFDSCLREFESDSEVRVAIVRGAGRCFSVGYDLSPTNPLIDDSADPASNRARFQGDIERLFRIWDCPKPVLAQVHGFALAGGSLFPLFCDLVTIASDARIGGPKVPAGGGFIAPMWAWKVGVKKAKEMSYTLREFSGVEAHEMGYANEVYPPEQLADATYALATRIAKMSCELLRIEKQAANRVAEAQGFRMSVLQSAEWDAIAYATDSVQRLHASLRDLGLRQTIADYDLNGL